MRNMNYLIYIFIHGFELSCHFTISVPKIIIKRQHWRWCQMLTTRKVTSLKRLEREKKKKRLKKKKKDMRLV